MIKQKIYILKNNICKIYFMLFFLIKFINYDNLLIYKYLNYIIIIIYILFLMLIKF